MPSATLVAVRVRVATINVQNDEGDPRRTGLLNRTLRDLAPDVVAFQEVCYPDRRDQLAELIAGTGLVHTTHESAVLTHEIEAGRPVRRHGGRHPLATSGARHRPGPADWWTLAIELTVADARRGAADHAMHAVAARRCGDPGMPGARDRRPGPAAPPSAADDHRRRLERRARRRRASGSVRAAVAGRAQRALPRRLGGGRRRTRTHLVDRQPPRRRRDRPRHPPSPATGAASTTCSSAPGTPTPRAQARITAARLFADRPVDRVWLSDHAGVAVDLDVKADVPPESSGGR